MESESENQGSILSQHLLPLSTIGSSLNTKTVIKIMVLYGRENGKEFRVEKRSRERQKERVPDHSLSPSRGGLDCSRCSVIGLIFSCPY